MKNAWLIVMCLIAVLGCDTQKAPVVKIGAPLPAASLPSLDGAMVELPATMKGKVIVLLFWAEGCKYCERGMPEIEAMYERLKAQGYEFVTVQVGGGRSASEELQKKFGLTFRMLYDSKSDIIKPYGIAGVPTMFVVDRQGAVREKVLGGLEAATLQELVQKYLK